MASVAGRAVLGGAGRGGLRSLQGLSRPLMSPFHRSWGWTDVRVSWAHLWGPDSGYKSSSPWRRLAFRQWAMIPPGPARPFCSPLAPGGQRPERGKGNCPETEGAASPPAGVPYAHWPPVTTVYPVSVRFVSADYASTDPSRRGEQAPDEAGQLKGREGTAREV